MMITFIIAAILLFAFVLISTENLTNVNRAAVAIFAGTVGWMLYVSWGADFITEWHPEEYLAFLNGATPDADSAKLFIAQEVFLKYVGRAAEIVLFLLATMTIVEILNNNGCFDYITQWAKTRNSRLLLWRLTAATFLISANLDNVTTTVMMLVIMREMVSNRKQRLVYGSAVVIAANAGGALTVIGDPSGLVLWNMGAVTASNFSFSLLIPCLVACAVPVYLLGRTLPERVDIQWVPMPYRGDDTNLNLWQRLLMLLVGIGGLWFIPSFHHITKLSPFIGALCVLSVLWVVNEVFNRKLMDVDKMSQRRMPRVLQYGVIQMMLFVLGIMLAIGAVQETGAIKWLADAYDEQLHSPWILGVVAGGVSCVLDNFATAMTFFSFHTVNEVSANGLMEPFVQNGEYWKIIAYVTALGGNTLIIGSLSGIAWMKMENVRMGWFFRNVGWRALVGALIGLATLYFTADWHFTL